MEAELKVSAFGERLRREREMRGISLDEIAAATKIGTRLLRALEDEQFELLPGGIFNKGFVRAYAKYLGINEDETVAEYLEAARRSNGDPHVASLDHYPEQPYSAGERPRSPSSRSSFPFIPVLILLVVVAGGLGGWRMYQQHRQDVAVRHASPDAVPAGSSASDVAPALSGGGETPSRNGAGAQQPHESTSAKAAVRFPAETSQSPSTKQKSADAVKPSPPASPAHDSNAASDGLMASAAAGEAANTPFEVSVRAKDRAWVSIKSDGKILVRGIIKPPDVKTIRASDQVIFFTGNAADVEVSFNGKEVPLSGGQNEERVLVFNSRGLLPAQAAQ